MAENNTTPKIGDTHGAMVYTESGWVTDQEQVEAKAAAFEASKRPVEQSKGDSVANNVATAALMLTVIAVPIIAVVLLASWLFGGDDMPDSIYPATVLEHCSDPSADIWLAPPSVRERLGFDYIDCDNVRAEQGWRA